MQRFLPFVQQLSNLAWNGFDYPLASACHLARLQKGKGALEHTPSLRGGTEQRGEIVIAGIGIGAGSCGCYSSDRGLFRKRTVDFEYESPAPARLVYRSSMPAISSLKVASSSSNRFSLSSMTATQSAIMARIRRY